MASRMQALRLLPNCWASSSSRCSTAGSTRTPITMAPAVQRFVAQLIRDQKSGLVQLESSSNWLLHDCLMRDVSVSQERISLGPVRLATELPLSRT